MDELEADAAEIDLRQRAALARPQRLAIDEDDATFLQSLHGLPSGCGKLLEATAYLHDVGHYISGVSHHKHSYYVVSNSDLAGFTDRERYLIAALCRYHRKSLPSPMHNAYQSLSTEEKRILTLLIPLLRLADNLDRSHEQRIQSVDCLLNGAGEVTLHVHSSGNIDLEQWAAERAADTFRQIYNRPVSVMKARS